ncbi:MAG: hypothetical protein HQ481_10470 [Alphaproteobacteria bacterium]|nr:hypothetical protein [Alphaproteobacteria bacterium]
MDNQVRWLLNRPAVEDVLEGRVPGTVGTKADLETHSTAAANTAAAEHRH